MHRMLVVVFENEDKATQGRKALSYLDDAGRIVVHAWAIIVKNADQTTTIRQSVSPEPLGTLIGTSLGGLIGLLGGSAGMVIGCTTGLLAGVIVDATKAMVDAEFIDDVSKELQADRFALLADVEEDSVTPVDACMEPLGGIVFRRTVFTRADYVAAMKADLAQMKAELTQAHADRKAKLQKKINDFDSNIQQQLWNAEERRQEDELGAQAKAEALDAKIAASKAPAATTCTRAGRENKRDGTQNKAERKTKCEHEWCQCPVGPPAEYCSDYCSGAEAMGQPELQCKCGHTSCNTK